MEQGRNVKKSGLLECRKAYDSEHIMPLPEKMVGIDRMIEIKNSVMEKEASKIGIYSQKGGGLTTLINFLNNEFVILNKEKDYHVFLCSASETPKATEVRIRERIACEMGLSNMSRWKDEEDNKVKAGMIFGALWGKRYVLLLDDVDDIINLEHIGIPCPTEQNGCKFVFCTSDLFLLEFNRPDKELHLARLSSEDSWKLFSQSLGNHQNSLSIPWIRSAAEKIVRTCEGLPKVVYYVANLILTSGKNDLDLDWVNCQNLLFFLEHCSQLLQGRINDCNLHLVDRAEEYLYCIECVRKMEAGITPIKPHGQNLLLDAPSLLRHFGNAFFRKEDSTWEMWLGK